jgi:hypothetical protein
MRKLYEATGGESQHWESLGNLGATKADAAGIAYAVERDTPAATQQTIAESHFNAHHSHGWHAAMQNERRGRACRPHATMSIDQTQDGGARLERKTGLGDRPCKTTISF